MPALLVDVDKNPHLLVFKTGNLIEVHAGIYGEADQAALHHGKPAHHLSELILGDSQRFR
ncbi:hypothetical protein D3C78_1663520 [compost metagenome]